ncbi:MAG TPA: hypothetical protein VFO41_14505 [Alphaproteobacteria bacterium]|nr:hypothetical protein [Alphaproteobacteria bacterium]
MLQDLYLSLGGSAIAWYRDPFILHLLMAAAAQWPLVRLLRRAGLSPYWALLMFVPLVGPALAGSALIFQRWPNLPPAPPRRRRR